MTSVVVPVPARGVAACFRCHTPVDPHIGTTLMALNRVAVTGVGAVLCPGCVDVLAVVAPIPAENSVLVGGGAGVPDTVSGTPAESDMSYEDFELGWALIGRWNQLAKWTVDEDLVARQKAIIALADRSPDRARHWFYRLADRSPDRARHWFYRHITASPVLPPVRVENGSGGVEAAVTAPPPDHPTAGGAL